MAFLLNNSGGKVLLSGKDDGSAVLLSGLATPLIVVGVIQSVSEQPVQTTNEESGQSASEAAVQFVGLLSVQGVSGTAVQDTTIESIASVSQEHVKDVE